MRRIIWNYRINFLILFCLSVLFWLLSKNAYAELLGQQPSTTFQNAGSLLAEDYEPMHRLELQAKEPIPFTLWTQSDNQRLEGMGTGRVQNASWLAVKGDTRLLLPVMQTLHEDDVDGCLIDRFTAEKLFRNNNAVGGIIKMGDSEYTVRGVFDNPSRTMVTQLARESTQILSNITVMGADNTEAFLLRHGLTAAVTVKSSQYVSLARFFCFLPVMAVILICLLLLGLLRVRWRSYQVRYLIVSIGMLAAGTGGLLLLTTFIPEKLIPSQWSDFKFWETAGTEFIQMVTDFVASAKYRPDLGWLHGVLKSASGILGAHFLMCMYNLYRIRNGGYSTMMQYEAFPELPQMKSGKGVQKVLQDVS